MEKIVNVIGAGLAGVEACHQLVKEDIKFDCMKCVLKR